VKFPTGLKIVIIYLVIYGLLIELFVFNNWTDWNGAVAGKSLGFTLGYFMKGPLLGLLFLYSAYGLSKKTNMGSQVSSREFAVCCINRYKFFCMGVC